jgi:hypothetical protein
VTTQERSERYERERVDASARHKRKLEQMRVSREHEELESKARLEEAALELLPAKPAA